MHPPCGSPLMFNTATVLISYLRLDMRESRSSGDSRSRPRGPWRANLEPRRTTSAVAGLIVRAAATCIPAPDSRQTPGPGGFSQGRLCVYVRQDETSRLLKPGRVASQLPGWHRPGQRDNPPPLRLGDPALAPGAGLVAQPVDAGGVEPVQPAAHRVLMAADLGRDRRDTQPVPAQRDDRARSIQSAGACRAPASLRIFLASPSSCGARALRYFGTELASSQSADLPVPHLTTQRGTQH